MKGLLLAAGLGTRLRPLTETKPKTLVEISGRPLLGWWFLHLENQGINEIVINLHHLPDQVRNFVDQYDGSLSITLFEEPTLLGSAGTLSACQEYLRGEDDFFILYGDNLTNVDLRGLARYHVEERPLLTVGLFRAPNPSACGIAEIEGEHSGRILSFVEKPSEPRGDLASAGLFVASPDIFSHLPPPGDAPTDFGGGVMPGLVGRMNGLVVDGYIRDIGTHESLRAARMEWPEVMKENESESSERTSGL